MKSRYEVTLSLGGIAILLVSKEKRVIDLAKKAFKGFITSNTKPSISINVIFDKYFKDTNPYVYGRPHRTTVTKEAGRIFVRGSVYRGFLDPDSFIGEIRQDLAVAPLYLYLRFAVSIYLPQRDGFLMHASSVARDNLAYLFSGPPQSGKSTIARLSNNYTVLSDDFSIVRKINEEFVCFGSPFWGHVEAGGENIKGKNDYIAIKGLYFIKQDDESYVRKIDKMEAALRLIQNISVIAKDTEINKQILRLADEFTDRVTVDSLHFKLNSSFWRCIE